MKQQQYNSKGKNKKPSLLFYWIKFGEWTKVERYLTEEIFLRVAKKKKEKKKENIPLWNSFSSTYTPNN